MKNILLGLLFALLVTASACFTYTQILIGSRAYNASSECIRGYIKMGIERRDIIVDDYTCYLKEDL